MTTMDESQNLPKGRGYVLLVTGFFGLFAALCTVFALFVTAGEGWVEHAQAQWPRATARVQRCDVDICTHNPDTYWIDCSLSYTVRGEDVVSHVHSRSIPAPSRWQYPTGQLEQLQGWVDEHPEGTPIVVHYDPANHKRAVLVTTDMPMGGPQTRNNLKLLGFCAVSCVVLLAIARIVRARVGGVRGQLGG
jgi:hypothetical protein